MEVRYGIASSKEEALPFLRGERDSDVFRKGVCFSSFDSMLNAWNREHKPNAREQSKPRLNSYAGYKYYYLTDDFELEYAQKVVDYINKHCNCAVVSIAESFKHKEFVYAIEQKSAKRNRTAMRQKNLSSDIVYLTGDDVRKMYKGYPVWECAQFLFEIEYDVSKFNSPYGLYCFLYMTSVALRFGSLGEDRIDSYYHKQGYRITADFLARISNASYSDVHSFSHDTILTNQEVERLFSSRIYNACIKSTRNFASYGIRPSQTIISHSIRKHLEQLEARKEKRNEERKAKMGMEMEAQPEQAYGLEIKLEGMPEAAQ